MKSAIEKGNTTEAEVMYLLVKSGYPVFTPVNDGCSVDLVTILSGNTVRVQVKYCEDNRSSEKTAFTMQIRKEDGGSKSPYTKDEIDYFATTYEGNLYMIPIEDVETKTKLTLVTKNNRMQNRKGKPMLSAEKYIII